MSKEQRSLTWLGALVATVFGVLMFLGVGEISMRALYPEWREFYSGRFIEKETVPGYSDTALGKRNFDGFFAQNNGDFRVSIRINEFGLRNDEPVTEAGGRIWVVGDSMAFGWGVETSEMYSSIIASRTGLLTYNVSSPGTDICGYQSLIARMPKSVQPTSVILGVILENDIREYDCRKEAARKRPVPETTIDLNINFAQLKIWLVENSALYNAVSVSLKRVPMALGLLKQFGLVNHEHAYKITFDDTQASQLAKSVAQEISRTRSLFPSDIPFAVLLTPARFEIRDDDVVYRNLRIKVVEALAFEGIDAIDPFLRFKKAGFSTTHFTHDGHWSPLGHAIAGEDAVKWLMAVSP